MKRLFIILTLLFNGISYAQNTICVYTTSISLYENEKVYKEKKSTVSNGIVYVFDTTLKEVSKYLISDGIMNNPQPIIGNDYWIALYFKGLYYFTEVFKANSMIANSEYWIFNIEESAESKDIFGTYYFALSIPPFEYGVTKYKNKKAYHKRGKKSVRKADKNYQSH